MSADRDDANPPRVAGADDGTENERHRHVLPRRWQAVDLAAVGPTQRHGVRGPPPRGGRQRDGAGHPDDAPHHGPPQRKTFAHVGHGAQPCAHGSGSALVTRHHSPAGLAAGVSSGSVRDGRPIGQDICGEPADEQATESGQEPQEDQRVDRLGVPAESPQQPCLHRTSPPNIPNGARKPTIRVRPYATADTNRPTTPAHSPDHSQLRTIRPSAPRMSNATSTQATAASRRLLLLTRTAVGVRLSEWSRPPSCRSDSPRQRPLPRSVGSRRAAPTPRARRKPALATP